MSRSRITGFKRTLIGDESEKAAGDSSRAQKSNVLISEIIPTAIYGAGCFIAFTFINAQTGVKTNDDDTVNSTLRVIICSLAPIAINTGVLFFMMAMSCCSGPLFGMCCKKTGSVMAGISHGISLIVHIIFFIVMWVLEGFNFARMLLGITTCIQCQRLIFQLMTVFLLTREFKNDHANSAFWTGKWYVKSLGYMAWTQPWREVVVKIIESSEFAADFVLGHIILICHLPFICIPQIDKLHSMMLFWLKPSKQIRPPIFSLKQARLRRRMVKKYAFLYFAMLIFFVACIVAPAVAANYVPKDIGSSLSGITKNLFQPRSQDNNDTGWGITTEEGRYYHEKPSHLQSWSATIK